MRPLFDPAQYPWKNGLNCHIKKQMLEVLVVLWTIYEASINMLTMNKTVYVVTKALTACSTLFLLIVGSTYVYLALSAIYGTTVNPEISLLLVPGILILIFSLLPLSSILFLRKRHSRFLHYTAMILSLSIGLFILCYFLR